ncbi:MAG: hypothetical protein ACOZAN_05260 [Patescibacteria group bacterium]
MTSTTLSPKENQSASEQAAYLEQDTLSSQTVPKNKKKPLMVVGAAIGLVIAAVLGIFFLAEVMMRPARIRDQVVMSKRVIDDYQKDLDEMIDVMVNDEVETADGMERASEEAKSLLKDAEDNHKKLADLEESITLGQLEDYKEAVSKYRDVAEKIIAAQKDYAMLSEQYVGPFRELEDLNVKMEGISQYMFDDPDKYVSELNQYSKKQAEIADTFKKIETKGWFVETHQVVISTFDATSNFMVLMASAVSNRSQNEIRSAGQKFAEDMQKVQNDSEKAEDNFDRQAKDALEELNDSYAAIEEEYDNLKLKYKF